MIKKLEKIIIEIEQKQNLPYDYDINATTLTINLHIVDNQYRCTTYKLKPTILLWKQKINPLILVYKC